MDSYKRKKNISFSNNSKIDRMKNKKELKLRLIKLTNNYFKPRCEHYINSVRSFNLKIMEYSGGRKTVEKAINDNKNFHFGKKKDSLIHLTDLSSYNIDIIPFIKNLKDKFTLDELEIIKKDKEYYLTNEILKENLSMFNVPPLYQIINKEEEDEKKAGKVFHNLNYFNKKRRMNDLIQKKTSNEINKENFNIEPIHKKVYKYGKNLEENHDKMKNNYMNLIEKEIRVGIRKKNKENKNRSNINGNNNENFLSLMEKESKNEYKKFIKYKEELDLKNKLTLHLETGKKNKKFPAIRNNTFTNNYKIKNDEINLSKINKRKKSYSKEKEKKRDRAKKIIDYEQKMIRDVNRRIKNIYENLNRKKQSIG